MWAGAQRTLLVVLAGGDSEAGLMLPVVAARKVCGVFVAMLLGEELGADPVDRDVVNVGTVPVLPSPPPPGGSGQARCWLRGLSI